MLAAGASRDLLILYEYSNISINLPKKPSSVQDTNSEYNGISSIKSVLVVVS